MKEFAGKYNVKVTTVPTRFSLKEAEERGDRYTEKLASQGFSFVSYSIDGDTLEILAKLPPDSKIKGGDVLDKEQAAAFLGLERGNQDIMDIEFVVFDDNDEDPEGDEHTYGGRRISSSSSQCTTAFSVVHSSGTTGITTAAHCTG